MGRVNTLNASFPRLVFLVLAVLSMLALDAAARAEGTVSSPRHAARRAPAGGELVCPAKVGIGEPFVVRVRLPWRAREASVRFLGRSAPLELRAAGGGVEACAVLGADVLDARPGWKTVTVRAVPASGGSTRTFARRVELAFVSRPVERLSLDPAMVTPPREEVPRIAAERALSRQALARTGTKRLWSLPLARPLDTEVSSLYGVGRVLNGQPRSPHRGLDLEASVGDPVRAADHGVVALAGDFYYPGQCVYLDHGQGLVTMYFHLSERLVQMGQRVERGQVLGLAGESGRSTRAHLHFGVAALGRLVDPEPLFLYDGRQ
ncbi:Murein DD-endopeptidase MepM and murein hydrolase activator NlpD, contain LysM domain [Humidesulfovibrio mexicanus]|uniref:Murein DD-endopeptidase MepM and murein hydrolase activator NlpD, contain LysM domain n=1 Tax=Humidesulfovibrio mexicanus TaxID=147047 RepID=A0A239ARC8_9BACT|nr:M23 family metallopeptidase [Humidesulfovibrio mexicanus]SNR97872.1 Murein DD-endopeptidase MepM and murein hydrolase activator NlpD, contain LysM domain [Humidesulfovibrio mexicanus]